MCLPLLLSFRATIDVVSTLVFGKKKGKKVNFDRINVGERAALGCRNPHPTPGYKRAFKIVTSRKGERW
jgi:hypothetical protein